MELRLWLDRPDPGTGQFSPRLDFCKVKEDCISLAAEIEFQKDYKIYKLIWHNSSVHSGEYQYFCRDFKRVLQRGHHVTGAARIVAVAPFFFRGE